MSATPLLILGSGSFATEVLDIAEATGVFEPAGFVNSLVRPAPGAWHESLPVYWIDDVPLGPGECLLVAGIVDVARRGFIETMQARGYEFARVVHPAAVVSTRAALHEGCVVHAGTVVSANSEIGPHVIVNRGATIGHDNQIGPYCTIGPGATLAGAVSVGEQTLIGAGAVVRDHLAIGARAVVGAGAVVVSPVPDGATVIGVPARLMTRPVETTGAGHAG